jgi:hypothetical protein
MCIIIVKPSDKTLTDQQIRNSFSNNADGAGFMWNSDGRVHIRKPFFKLEQFMESYKSALESHPEATFVLHFRITTHGAEDKVNTHPHRLNERLAFAHNGIISGVGYNKELSDTVLFSQKYLSKFPEKELFGRDEVIGLLEEFLSGSKIAMLNGDGDFKIYNEPKGEWEEGCWFSNSSHSYNRVYSGSSYNSRYSSSIMQGWDDDDAVWGGNTTDTGRDHLNGGIRAGWKVEVGVKCYYCATPLDSKRSKEYGLCDGCLDTLLDDDKTTSLDHVTIIEDGDDKALITV